MKSIDVSTNSKSEMIDITSKINKYVNDIMDDNGVITVYVPHTTCGITINEGADPAVKSDILKTLDQKIPWNNNYKHAEGNSAAHIKSSVMGSSVNLIVRNGRIQLGTWQKVFLCEFDGPRRRKIWIEYFTK
ncbi:MAG TPA: secondary thiamine-phosphate synthase enzyme YjbQ [Candidatus Mcinerneyibacterium sp.]|nr:secondary thiamine-phosphate synthase enzyme YjbQ [Candidatus Mcinerneyibacterium sp.]